MYYQIEGMRTIKKSGAKNKIDLAMANSFYVLEGTKLI